MKRAFSMIELIFIIVLMGVLAKVGSGFLPDNRLLNDTNFISMKIKEKQNSAIGYDNFRFGNVAFWDENSSDFNRTCLQLEKNYLENLDTTYGLFSTISSSLPTLCFDVFGRPYRSDALLDESVDVNISYKNKINTLSVLPMSGYVIIKQNP